MAEPATLPTAQNAAPNTAQQGHPLSGLADMHMPDPVSWWPPAPGWWILSVIVLLTLAAAVYWIRKRRQKSAPRRFALAELNRLETELLSAGERHAFVVELSALLRRAAIQAHGRAAVASLAGDDWLAFLDSSGNTNHFTRDVGQLLADAAYRPANTIDENADLTTLAEFVRDWLKVNL